MDNDRLPSVRRSFYSLYIKRLLDILLSGTAIILLSPLFLLISVLELICHGRPILYSQERPGYGEKLFRIYKFRSMTNATDDKGCLLPGHQRLTGLGKVLRRFSLDELPELFCIFTGKMSIIGPRPLLPEYLPYYTERHRMRHMVRPGLACVPLKEMSTWTWNDQFENDIWYIEHISFPTDLRMIFGIAREALKGSTYRVEDEREPFTPDYWKSLR